MSLIRIILINLLVLIFLLVVSEVGIRLAWTFKSCFSSNCDYSRLLAFKVRNIPESWSIGLSQYDKQLGYVPHANFSSIVDAPGYGWNSVSVNIDERSFRKNDLLISAVTPKVLAVGDSFTFGDQVSDFDTWPACLQKKFGQGVVNAGVFGYGAAQALKRAKYELLTNSYDLLIFSILVAEDFDRDRLDYRNGFPRPAVIKDNGVITWAPVPDVNRSGSKFLPASRSKFAFFYQNSILIAGIWDRAFPTYDWSGNNLYSVHPKAAGEEEIIEWTLTEFSKLNKVKKILVLQYGENLDDKHALRNRDSVIKLSKLLDIKVVDTYEALRAYDPQLLWYGHHTPFGNEVVCDLIKGAISR
jgi:hypothetical protein